VNKKPEETEDYIFLPVTVEQMVHIPILHLQVYI
jgi:hypothetical protein